MWISGVETRKEGLPRKLVEGLERERREEGGNMGEEIGDKIGDKIGEKICKRTA